MTLPAIEVTATPLPRLPERTVRSGYDTNAASGNNDDYGNASLHDAGLTLSLPQLSMPYYSFGSTTLQIRKD